MASRSNTLNELDLGNPHNWFLQMTASHEILQASSGKQVSKKMFMLATMGSKALALLADLLAPKKRIR